MLEFKRLLKTTSIRWCLVIITLLGMILYLFNQLNGLTIQEFLARNNTYHSLIYAQQKSPQTVEEISRDLKDITIRNVLSDPNNFLYTSYLEEYPEYVSSADAEQENLHDLEWAYTALLHQVNFHSQLLSRPEKMRMEYEQKISNPLFRNQQNTLDTMQQTIIDFGKIADVRPSVGDDRLITSVTENHYNLLLQLVLIVCVATVLRFEKQSPLWYTLSATKRGRRWLAWSKICCLLYFTILSQLLLLVPQFIISSILYDGSNQCMRLIQSVETFSKVLIPCTIPFFTAIYIISSMILFSFVTMLAWTLMSCLHHRNFVLVVFAALLGISYISYLLPGKHSVYLVQIY